MDGISNVAPEQTVGKEKIKRFCSKNKNRLRCCLSRKQNELGWAAARAGNPAVGRVPWVLLTHSGSIVLTLSLLIF